MLLVRCFLIDMKILILILCSKIMTQPYSRRKYRSSHLPYFKSEPTATPFSIKVISFSIRERFSSRAAYQTFKEASRPRDYDEDLPNQLGDDSYLLAFRALVGLENSEGEQRCWVYLCITAYKQACPKIEI